MAERLAHVLVDPPVCQAEGAAVGGEQVHEEAVLGHLPLRLGWEGRGRRWSGPSAGQPPPGDLPSAGAPTPPPSRPALLVFHTP